MASSTNSQAQKETKRAFWLVGKHLFQALKSSLKKTHIPKIFCFLPRQVTSPGTNQRDTLWGTRVRQYRSFCSQRQNISRLSLDATMMDRYICVLSHLVSIKAWSRGETEWSRVLVLFVYHQLEWRYIEHLKICTA